VLRRELLLERLLMTQTAAAMRREDIRGPQALLTGARARRPTMMLTLLISKLAK
jgi:hypothetical protein